VQDRRKEKKEKRGGRAGSIFVLKKEEGNQERETDWVERETTETEKHKKNRGISAGKLRETDGEKREKEQKG
jgi:hypothetical protein